MSAAQTITSGLAELEALGRAELAERWQALMKRPPPKAASRVFLLRALSYELQAGRAPGLSKADQKVLENALADSSRNEKEHEGASGSTRGSLAKASPSKPRTVLVPGSRLVREWNGKAYTVSVIEEGFVYQDNVWSSLSAIAKDITGAHWSGPRFFGLNKATRS